MYCIHDDMPNKNQIIFTTTTTTTYRSVMTYFSWQEMSGLNEDDDAEQTIKLAGLNRKQMVIKQKPTERDAPKVDEYEEDSSDEEVTLILFFNDFPLFTDFLCSFHQLVWRNWAFVCLSFSFSVSLSWSTTLFLTYTNIYNI